MACHAACATAAFPLFYFKSGSRIMYILPSKTFFPLPYLHNLQMLTSRTMSLKKNVKPMIEHSSFSIAFQSLVNKKMLSNFFLKMKVTWGYLMNQKIEGPVH